MQVENFPPHFEHFPEHDHTADGQEEVYTALSGCRDAARRRRQHELVPGTFARVGPGVTRRITTGDQPVQLLAIGGDPGQPYSRPGVHRERRSRCLAEPQRPALRAGGLPALSSPI